MLPPMRLLLLGVLGVVFTVGCVHAPSSPPPSSTPALEPADVARLLPPTVKDRDGWADDIVVAIRMTGKVPTAERACAVIAVIGQESGFKAGPPVANLPKIVREGLDEKLAPLGPLAGPARDAILEGHAPGDTRTFGERIAALKTERDLDRFFRDVAAAYRGEMRALSCWRRGGGGGPSRRPSARRGARRTRRVR